MSFHSVLIGATVWPADLVTAGVVAAAGQVYSGRRAQKVPEPTEVWLERLPTEQAGAGMQALTLHPYLVHVRTTKTPGGKNTGKPALDVVEAHMKTITERYSGARPFVSALPNLVWAKAQEESVDTDTTQERVLDGSVRVTFAVKG